MSVLENQQCRTSNLHTVVPTVSMLQPTRLTPVSCHTAATHTGKNGACQSIVAATIAPYKCADVKDPDIISNNPDFCVSASCPQGGVLAGFSCQVTVGTPSGFYIADSTGNFPTTGSSPTQVICTAMYQKDTTDATIFKAGTCCIGGGDGDDGMGGGGAGGGGGGMRRGRMQAVGSKQT